MTVQPDLITDEDRALLHELWRLQLRALVETMKATPAAELKAAQHQVIRQFLSDQSIDKTTLEREQAKASFRSGVQSYDPITEDQLFG